MRLDEFLDHRSQSRQKPALCLKKHQRKRIPHGQEILTLQVQADLMTTLVSSLCLKITNYERRPALHC